MYAGHEGTRQHTSNTPASAMSVVLDMPAPMATPVRSRAIWLAGIHSPSCSACLAADVAPWFQGDSTTCLCRCTQRQHGASRVASRVVPRVPGGLHHSCGVHWSSNTARELVKACSLALCRWCVGGRYTGMRAATSGRSVGCSTRVAESPASNRVQVLCTPTPRGVTAPRPLTTTRRGGGGLLDVCARRRVYAAAVFVTRCHIWACCWIMLMHDVGTPQWL